MEYIVAKNIAKALSALSNAAGCGKIIAGGTDLVTDLEEGRVKANILVDISNIPELNEIRVDDGELIIGGAVTHTMASRSELVQKYAPALASACRKVGSLQIRNVATVAGNVANAQPAADAAVALSALGAVFTVIDGSSRRQLAMAEMYQGLHKSTVDSSRELISSIHIPCQDAGEASDFVRLELRQSLALPMLNVAAMVKMTVGSVVWARIAMAPVGIGPVRSAAAEEWLKGRPLTEEVINHASELILTEANPRSNPLRGSREYRLQTLPVLVRRVLNNIAKQLLVTQADTRG